MKENSSQEEEAAAKSGTFTAARLTPAVHSYDPRAIAQIPGQASIKPNKFFKDKGKREDRKSHVLSYDYISWRNNRTFLSKAKVKKPVKITRPFSNDEDYLPPLLKTTKRKPPQAPPVPVFNGNLPSLPFASEKVVPSPSASVSNGNISPEAAAARPSGNSREVMDLSDGDGDNQEPRSGLVSPHQVGFQVG